MRHLTLIFRGLAVALLILFAALAALTSYATLTRLDAGTAYMRMNEMRFSALGEFVMDYQRQHHEFPDDTVMQGWSIQNGYDKEWASSIRGDRVGGHSLACTRGQPEVGFKLPSQDTFVLNRWRGEWFDCFSLPSGTNNLVRSLDGGSALFHIVCWLVASACISVAWLVRPKQLRDAYSAHHPSSVNIGPSS